MPSRLYKGVILTGILAASASVACGQDYPNKPIRILAPAPGGGVDFVARIVAQGLTVNLGQQTIVDNRSSGVIPGSIVSKAPPDGYTLIVASGNLWVGTLMQDAPYDALRDFAPITLTTRQPNVLVVYPALPAKSVKELIALAKAKPGDLNYASTGTGSSSHLAAELFKSMAGVNIVRISYKGTGVVIGDLVSGQVQLMFATAASITPHIKSGRLRGVAVTSAEPSTLVPGLPTVAASLPGYESVSMHGVFAPAKTPAAIINRLNQVLVRFLATPETKERFLNGGLEVVGTTPQQLTATMKAEMGRLGKMIKELGIREDSAGA